MYANVTLNVGTAPSGNVRPSRLTALVARRWNEPVMVLSEPRVAVVRDRSRCPALPSRLPS